MQQKSIWKSSSVIETVGWRFRHRLNCGRVLSEKNISLPLGLTHPQYKQSVNLPNVASTAKVLRVTATEEVARRFHTGHTTPRHSSLAEIKTAATRNLSRLTGLRNRAALTICNRNKYLLIYLSPRAQNQSEHRSRVRRGRTAATINWIRYNCTQNSCRYVAVPYETLKLQWADVNPQ